MTLKSVFTGAVVAALTTTSAFAHATFEAKEVATNTTHKAVVRIAHGCDGEATLKVRVTIPEGVIAVKPKAIANWTLETVKGDYAGSYEYHGTHTSGVKEIIWTGNLPNDHYEEFIFRARFTDALKAGEKLYFPVVQECANGENAWVELPNGDEKLKSPAPGLMITEGHAAHTH